MLSALLLAALIAASLATVVLFVPIPVVRRSAGVWPWVRRLIGALAGTAVLGGVVAGILALLGVTRSNIEFGVAGIVVASVVWLPATRDWRAAGHLCWATTTLLFVAYLAFMLHWTFVSHLGGLGTAGSLVLWTLELFAALLSAAYLWELCDTLGRESWRRRVRRLPPAPSATPTLPFVSLHVPAYNEPPEMVIDTLTSAAALDYERFEVIAIDDNSSEEALWRPVEAWCHDNAVKFVHLHDWPGYKSGALNYALRHETDPRAELVGVVDSDYQLDPAFLQRCVPLFEDPKIGFIQAPQDYRDWQVAPFYRRLYYSYRYFFAVSQPSRNERDGAIFAGTMGLIRRQALEEVGGWDEWCITEDAELSLRLLRAGWSGLSVDYSFGHGIMPLTFEALKGQRFRWCFGGIQILRRHWRWLMPGDPTPDNRLGLGQRWSYLSGAIQWYGDLLALVFFFLLLIGAANLALGGGVLFRKLSGFLVATIPLLVALGLVRAVALLRRGTGASWREALGAFVVWQSTALIVARASVQGLFAKQAEFLRTPKTSDDATIWDALRSNWGETTLAALGLAGIAVRLARIGGYAGPLTAALLVWPTIAFASAPINSFAAHRAVLPDDLRARRRTEYLRSGMTRRVTVAAGGLVAAGAAATAALALLAGGTATVSAPQLIGPARGRPDQARTAPTAPPSTTVPHRATTSTTLRPSTSTTTSTPHSTSTTSPTSVTPSTTTAPAAAAGATATGTTTPAPAPAPHG
jgi:cellulose synthase/poly-beta-1,6-N-acetylglucosamine synthase-like glycosyltransferase